MRPATLAALFSLTALPGLALAQSVSNPPPDGPGMMGGPGMGGPGAGGPGMGGPGWQHGRRPPEDPMAFMMKFYAANTTHDGHLTLAQAKTGGLAVIAGHFDEIDVKRLGYVTLYDIEAWHLDDMARRLEERADQLRAQD